MLHFFKKKTRIYLDHASTTPLDPRVFSAMEQVYKNGYFNPGGLYREGVLANQKISEYRKSVAGLLGTTTNSVIFTRGGTESCNLAILGVIGKWKNNNPGIIPHVIMSEIEHSAVIETLRNLARKTEIYLSSIPVTSEGLVDVDEVKKMIRPTTILISVMYVNNEIGTVQPMREITKLVRWFKKQNDLKEYPLVHTDAIQAANYLDINVERLGVDLMSLSGSKIYGPKSSGVLYVRNRDMVAPIIYGGDQEFGLRAGTEDAAQVVGFTEAFKIARDMADGESARLTNLQNYFFDEIKKSIPDLYINGSISERIPNNINISIPGISGERLVIELDARGISASSKSACREDADEESHVIAAIHRASHPQKGDGAATTGSLRFTMGRSTTRWDIDRTVRVLAEIIAKIRAFESFEKGL